ASISGPTDGSSLTSQTVITGTAASGSLWNWTLAYRPTGSGAFTSINTGSTPVSNAALGTFDPTVLLNGTDDIQLTVTDVSGRSSTAQITLIVQGTQKVGNFNITFTDLEVPAAGLPIDFTRTFDSRDKGLGDFG